jgi:hypothetical protein
MATVYKYTVETDASGSVKSLKMVEDQSEKTSDAVERVGKSAKRTTDATEELGDGAGKTASAMGMLGGVLGRIDPQLEEMARGVADVADSLDAATMFGSSAAKALGVIGAVAAVAGAAFVVLKNNLDNATEAMEKQAEAAQTMADLHNKVKEAALLAALAQEQITQEEFNTAVATRTAAEAFQEQRRQAEEEVRVLDEQIERQQEIIRLRTEQVERNAALAIDERALTEVNRNSITEMRNAAMAISQLNQERDLAGTRLEVLNAAEERYAEDLNTVADSQIEVTERVKEGTEAIKEMTDQVLSLSEAFTVLGLGTPGGVGIGIDIADPMSAQLGPMRERLELLAQQIEIRRRLQNLPGVDPGMAPPTMNAAANVAQGLGFIGAPSSALAAMGPAGAIFTALASIGQIGAQGISDQLEDLTNNVAEGVRALPTILLDVFPDFVDQLAAVLPEAIADAISELFVRLLDRIPGLEAQMGEDGLQVGLDRGDIGGQLLNFLTAASPALGLGVRNVVGLVQNRGGNSSSARAATQGRLMRADGAQRLAMSRAPTSTMFGQGATVIQQALGFDSGTQDRFQRRFSQLIDADTGLRGRT